MCIRDRDWKRGRPECCHRLVRHVRAEAFDHLSGITAHVLAGKQGCGPAVDLHTVDLVGESPEYERQRPEGTDLERTTGDPHPAWDIWQQVEVPEDLGREVVVRVAVGEHHPT